MPDPSSNVGKEHEARVREEIENMPCTIRVRLDDGVDKNDILNQTRADFAYPWTLRPDSFNPAAPFMFAESRYASGNSACCQKYDVLTRTPGLNSIVYISKQPEC